MSHNLFNRCCHFAYGDAAMRLKCVRHSKNAIFTQNFAMSVTPDYYACTKLITVLGMATTSTRKKG